MVGAPFLLLLLYNVPSRRFPCSGSLALCSVSFSPYLPDHRVHNWQDVQVWQHLHYRGRRRHRLVKSHGIRLAGFKLTDNVSTTQAARCSASTFLPCRPSSPHRPTSAHSTKMASIVTEPALAPHPTCKVVLSPLCPAVRGSALLSLAGCRTDSVARRRFRLAP